MTTRKARAILSGVWIGLSAPLILIAVVLSITKFGKDDWDVPWAWLIPLVSPALSLIIAVWLSGSTARNDSQLKSAEAFWGTFVLTLVYFIAAYLVIALYPLARVDLATHLRTSVWYLSLLQGLTTFALGKFYLENVR
jgi:uncharacterized BrkB/YihY/UPF0761 family membrane protein